MRRFTLRNKPDNHYEILMYHRYNIESSFESDKLRHIILSFVIFKLKINIILEPD